jgi:hypothetical protein
MRRDERKEKQTEREGNMSKNAGIGRDMALIVFCQIRPGNLATGRTKLLSRGVTKTF